MNARFVTFGMYLMALVALADQGTKWWILNQVMVPRRVVFVTPFLNFVLQWNKGITFGLFNHDQPMMLYVFIGSAVVILILLLNWLVHTTSFMAASGVSLVMGGALGNLADRINHGAVVDFLDFHAFGYHWYAFNIADAAIVCGVGLLLLENLVNKPKRL